MTIYEPNLKYIKSIGGESKKIFKNYQIFQGFKSNKIKGLFYLKKEKYD